MDLRPLYADPEKAKTIEQLCQSYLTNLGSPSGSYDSEGTPREPATAVLWTLYYLSQHHDYLGDHQLALQLVEQAIDHTPTLIELYLLKGKIYKVRLRSVCFVAVNDIVCLCPPSVSTWATSRNL